MKEASSCRRKAAIMRLLKRSLLLMLLVLAAGVASAQDATPAPAEAGSGLLGVLQLLAGEGGAAQDAPPIWDVLANIPDTPEARTAWSYADYAALTGGAADRQVWLDALATASSGPPLQYFLAQVEEQQRLTGVSIFDVAQAATWGQRPADVTLLQGPFDADAIEAAYSVRGFTAEPLGDFTLFCGADGCEAGTQANLGAREPGDPFGGPLGRQQPVLLVPLDGERSQLLSAAPLDVVQAAAETRAGAAPSLADSPAYQAATRAVTADGVLLQAYFVGVDTIVSFGRANTAEQAQLTPQATESLPPFDFATFAEVERDDGQAASVTLVFPTLAEAETAASLLALRLAAETETSFGAALQSFDITVSASAAQDADTGLGVAQLTFLAPPGEPSAYRLLIRGWLTAELGWLAP
jgi:hypothetical protein